MSDEEKRLLFKPGEGTSFDLTMLNRWAQITVTGRPVPLITVLRYECKYCKGLFEKNSLPEHEQSCPHIACRYCKKLFGDLTIEDHEKMCGMCPKKKKYFAKHFCQYCGDEFPSSKIESHEKLCAYAYQLYEQRLQNKKDKS